MATVPTTPPGPESSKAEEIKLVFLRQLELSSVELNGKHYHSVFTGAQIVDIILNHFGLPDRKLASKVASRLIDCSLYTHVSGPSQGAAGAGEVIDSNAEIYTLTSDALAVLKGLHKGDTLQRAKTHTRKRYMDIRGHLHSRSADSHGTSSSNVSGDSSNGSNISSQHASVAELNSARVRPPSLHSQQQQQQQQQPPPLDVCAAHMSAINKGNSLSDTLVAVGPATPSTATPTTDGSDGTGSPLREVCIPTGDLGSLLNTWSFVGAGRNSVLPLTPVSTSRSGQRSSSWLLPGDGAALLSGAMESDSEDSEGSRHWLRRGGGGGSQRVSRDLESVEWEQQRQQHQRRWGLCPVGDSRLRRCPSAPSLSEHQSDSDVSYLTAFRDSEQQQQQQQRPSRDSWYGGGGSSRLSDITVASSYVGTQHRGPLDRSILSFASAAHGGGSDGVMGGGGPGSEHQPLGAASSSGGDAGAGAGAGAGAALVQQMSANMPTPRTMPASAARSRSSSVRTSAEAGPCCRDSYESGEPAARQLQLWRDTVAPGLLQTLGPETIAQQEAVHELISTEAAYLRDLELIDTVFAQPLLGRADVMERARAAAFLHAVFFNYGALVENSRRLCAQLAERQQGAGTPVVAGVGDIFDAWADDLGALVEYAVHVPAAQSALERELLGSAAMAQFLADAEAAPGARRLPVQSFIGRPAARLARYPLLLDAAVKRAPADAPLLRRAAAKVRAALREIDRRTGEGAAAHRLRQISQRLRLPPGARASLGLDSAARRLVREGVLSVPETGARVLAFLFDNALVVAAEERVAHARGVTRYVADDRIVPISMLDACVPPAESGALVGIRDALLLRHSSSSSAVRASPAQPAPGGGLPLAFVHIGCRALSRTLLAASEADRDQWVAAVARRTCVPQTLVEAYTDVRLLSDRDFAHARAPLCSALFAAAAEPGCQMVLFGSRDGLHLGIYGVPTSVIRVSQPGTVSKIHILHDFNLVLVLSDGNLLVYSLAAIERSTASASLQLGAGLAGTKIASSVAFFDVGVFMAAPLVVLMKLRGSKSHLKCIQPRFNQVESDSSEETASSYGSSTAAGSEPLRPSLARSLPRSHTSSTLAPAPATAAPAHEDGGGNMPTLRVVYQGTRTSLHLISELAVPGRARRVHFLRRKLCIVSAKSFEIVDVQTNRLLRSLPDPMDDDFSFVIHSNDSGLALATCKVGREFLLCYEAFAFYIDNFGRRSRPHVFIRWEMRPSYISFRHPYIVAVNPKFIEIRHIETGVLLSIIRIKNAVCLNPDSTSTALHIAISPAAAVGTAALIATATPPQAQSAAEDMDEESATSAMPRPVVSTAALPAAESIQGFIVPGLSGTTGKRLFPEGNSTHYRIIEVRLPPLKPSSSSSSSSSRLPPPPPQAAVSR
ncbi:RHO1 GDP-GTP exchange protein 2 [Coemansia sp. BCRC 34962]|nr:RHO1 GDP-GTP exchange protein 2 [Coemansia sp. BCRC 34962]